MRNRKKGTEVYEESRKKSWENLLALSVEMTGMAMAEHRVWSFDGGQSTISSGLHLSLSWMAAAKKADFFSGLWNSCHEQWAISISLSAVLPGTSACLGSLICSVCMKGEMFLLHMEEVALYVRSWMVACYSVLALESRGCFWDWERKLGPVVYRYHCTLIAVECVYYKNICPMEISQTISYHSYFQVHNK